MPNAESLAPDASEMLDSLSDEINAVEGVFTAAADALVAGREQLFGLTRALETYRTGLAGLSGGDLVKSVAMTVDQFTRMRASFEDERRAITEIDQALAATSRAMGRLRAQVQTLQIFTSTARVVEAELGSDEDHGFSHQIKLLSGCSMDGLAELRRQSAGMRALTLVVRTRQTSFGDSGLAAIAGLSGELQHLSERIMPGLEQAGRDAGRTTEIADRLYALVSTAIAALQVGDSFRQRLEHALSALRSRPARQQSPQAHDLVTLLVGAQLEAAGRTLEEDLQRLAEAMQEISRKTASLAGWSQALRQSSEIAALLADLQNLCGASLAKLYSSQAERRLLDGQLRKLRSAIGDMQRVIQEQAVVDEKMKMGSYNVALRSRSAAATGSAMAYVARQIGELIDVCLAERREITAALETIPRTIAGSVARSDGRVSGRLDAIGDSLAGLSKMMHLWRELDGTLRALAEQGPEAIAAFDRCAARMQAQRASGARVRSLGAALCTPLALQATAELAAHPEARQAADAMRALYSVPEERSLHDRLCPPLGADPQAPPQEDTGQAAADEEFEWF